jgi:hypothetical protein
MDKEDLLFEIGFFEGVLDREPDNLEVLTVLGHICTLAGEYRKGLRIDERLAGLRPQDPIVQYNLACSQSLLRDVDAALASLGRAVSLGYTDYEHMLEDPDLAHVRSDRRFRDILTRLVRAARRGPGIPASAEQDQSE